jgi:hypothetical protein
MVDLIFLAPQGRKVGETVKAHSTSGKRGLGTLYTTWEGFLGK